MLADYSRAFNAALTFLQDHPHVAISGVTCGEVAGCLDHVQGSVYLWGGCVCVWGGGCVSEVGGCGVCGSLWGVWECVWDLCV